MATTANSVLEKISAPISVFLNITQECNMRCVYCSAEVTRPNSRKDIELSDEQYLDLVDQLVEAKVFKYVITGGEPLLRRRLVFQILDRIGRSAEVQFNSNATMINDRVAKRLAAFPGILNMVVSIDAPVEEINAITRGKGFLRKTMKGVRNLQKQGIDPKINCVLTRHNYRYIPQMVEFLKANGLRRLGILHFQPLGYGIPKASQLQLPIRERLEFNKMIRGLTEREKEVSISDQDESNWFEHENCYQQCVSHGLEKFTGRPNILPCSAGLDQANILSDGGVTPCNFFFHYRCGNVREQSFLDIWRNSPEFQRVRALRRTPNTVIEKCGGCRYNIFCQGGCRAIGHALTGSLTGHDGSCPHYQRRMSFQRPQSDGVHLPVIN
ncbi:MAG TPA: radical SAM protein [Acidobacteriota bacterium]|nr:radical SAM protein [Acidobacteriota bacterium]